MMRCVTPYDEMYETSCDKICKTSCEEICETSGDEMCETFLRCVTWMLTAPAVDVKDACRSDSRRALGSGAGRARRSRADSIMDSIPSRIARGV